MKLGTIAAAVVKDYAAPPPPPFFADGWDGGSASNWDPVKWPGQRTGSLIVSGGRGVISTGPRPIACSNRNVRDFDMVVQVQYSTLAGQFLEIGWRVNSFMETGTAPAEGYVLQIGQGTTAQIFRINTYTQIGSTISTPELSGGETVWFRIRSVGSNHKVRWWLDGDTEPSTWNFDVTDATYTEGAIMLDNYGSGVISFDNLFVAQVSAESALMGSLKVPKHATGAARASLSPSGITGANLTFGCWFQVANINAAGSPIIGLSDGGSNYMIIDVGASGNLRLLLPSGQINSSYTVTTDSWYFVAATRDASGCELYHAAEGDVTLIKETTAGVPTITAGEFHLLGNTYTVGSQGSVAASKVWLAKLSQSELTAEMASYDPIRTSGLYSSWLFKDGMSTVDDSGNGHTLAYSGGFVSGFRAPASV